MPRKSPYTIKLTAAEKASLESLARKYTSPYYSVARAKIVLLAAQGLGNDEIAHRLDMGRQVVSKWRKRFWKERVSGLEDRPREGRPPVFSPLD
jgi:transposase